MKTKTIFTAVFLAFIPFLKAQDATQIVKKADALMQGEQSSFSKMTMEIIRLTWSRSVSFKTWTKGRDYSLTLITAPAKEKGQAFLKRKNEMWNWNPTINRMIKLPPSMMSQGWMGSDYTNDDVVNQSSIVVDYDHSLQGSKTVNGVDCYEIRLEPKENAPVVWGKVMMWIGKNNSITMKVQYFDEDMELERTENAYNIKTMGGRKITAKFDILPADKPDQKTVVTINEIDFNIPIKESFFSQQNMKKAR